jgi:hypothetical protein
MRNAPTGIGDFLGNFQQHLRNSEGGSGKTHVKVETYWMQFSLSLQIFSVAMSNL